MYPVVVHWVWSADGWASAQKSKPQDDPGKLFGVGVIDFAGAGVVHMVGGLTALISASMIGPRHGRFVRHYLLDGHWYARTADQPLTQDAGVKWMEIVQSDSTAAGEEWRPVQYSFDLVHAEEKGTLEAQGTRWRSNRFPSQSSTFQTFGTLILWFGWYGFNCGSTLAVSNGGATVAAKVAVTTTLAAAGGALGASATNYIKEDMQDLGTMSNGLLAGLVSITAGCSVVEPWAALLIGVIGGVIYYYSVLILERLRVDDVVLAAPVHLSCGMWALFAAAIFASPLSYAASYQGAGKLSCGLLYAGAYGCDSAGAQLAAQLVYMVAILAWVGGTMSLLLCICHYMYARYATDSYGNSWRAGRPDFPYPLAYDRLAQMYGIDILQHGGDSGAEVIEQGLPPLCAQSDPS